MKNAATAEPNKHCLKHHQISLIILRFEVDDLHLTNQSQEAQLLANFNQNSNHDSYKKKLKTFLIAIFIFTVLCKFNISKKTFSSNIDIDSTRNGSNCNPSLDYCMM